MKTATYKCSITATTVTVTVSWYDNSDLVTLAYNRGHGGFSIVHNNVAREDARHTVRELLSVGWKRIA